MDYMLDPLDLDGKEDAIECRVEAMIDEVYESLDSLSFNVDVANFIDWNALEGRLRAIAENELEDEEAEQLIERYEERGY